VGFIKAPHRAIQPKFSLGGSIINKEAAQKAASESAANDRLTPEE
jgi:hypothetical protein